MHQELSLEKIKTIRDEMNSIKKINKSVLGMVLCTDEGLPVTSTFDNIEASAVLSGATAAIRNVVNHYVKYLALRDFKRIVIDYENGGILIVEVTKHLYLLVVFEKPSPLGILFRDVYAVINKIKAQLPSGQR